MKNKPLDSSIAMIEVSFCRFKLDQGFRTYLNQVRGVPVLYIRMAGHMLYAQQTPDHDGARILEMVIKESTSLYNSSVETVLHLFLIPVFSCYQLFLLSYLVLVPCLFFE